MKQKLIFLAGILIVLMIGLFLYLRSGDKTPKILKTATLKKGSVSQVLEATGIVKARVGAIVKIGAQATGLITDMLVQEGDPVSKGQLVALIDNRDLAAKERESLADLRRLEAVAPLRLVEAEADFNRAQAQENYARNNHQRLQQLFNQELVSADELDQSTQRLKTAESDTRLRAATLKRIRAETTQEILQAKARLESLQVDLSHTKIISPIQGFVSQVTAQKGETVVAGLQVANLITVLDPTRLEMWIYVDETDVGQVKVGQEVSYRVDAYPDQNFMGSVLTVYPQPEIRDNIVYYRALVGIKPDQARSLRPEMTTHCQILIQKKDNVLALPNEALKWMDGKQVVYVQAQDQKFKPITPKLGLSGLENSEILEGLSEGAIVATQLILPGTKKNKKD